MVSELLIAIDLYLPVFIVAVIGGIAGIIKRREFKCIKFLEVTICNGVMGVITLIFLQEYTDLSLESEYALICLLSYTGIDEAERILLRIKGFKRDGKTFS